MSKNILFRAWYYFRVGWSNYFAFIMAAVNTLVTTYYLAIKDAPFLHYVFPSFSMYVIILSTTAIPVLTLIGYIHFKKSPAFKAETAIAYESNPYWMRMLVASEDTLTLNLKMCEILVKMSKNERLSDNDVKEIMDMQQELREFSKKRTSE